MRTNFPLTTHARTRTISNCSNPCTSTVLFTSIMDLDELDDVNQQKHMYTLLTNSNQLFDEKLLHHNRDVVIGFTNGIRKVTHQRNIARYLYCVIELCDFLFREYRKRNESS